MSDNKRRKRPAYSSIPGAPLHFELGNNAVRKAERNFHQRWSALTEHHYGIDIDDLYLSLLGTPVLGELVDELELVLNKDGELRLNFLVGIPPNEPIYHEMAPINAVILRVNTDLDTTRKRTTSVTNTRPTPFKTAVGASDSGMRANDRVLLRGSLSNIRLFHILELLMVIYDEYYGAYDEGELISIPRDILPAIVAYIMRSFCTDWRVGDFWSGAHGARVAALLEDPCDDEQIQRFALRFVREFLRRWSTSTCPDLSGWKDLYQWVDYECLTLRSWPMGLPSLFPSHASLFRWRNSAFLDRSPEARPNKMTLQSFCHFTFSDEEIPEAHAVITQAHRWVNKNSLVHHEFLVVDAEITGCKFWVRIDRSRNDRDGATMRWDALDTVTVGIDTKPFEFKDERLENLSTVTFLIIDAQRRLPQLRDLSILLLAVEASFPSYIFHQANCWFVSSILAGTLRTLFGGNWAGGRLDWIQADELANFVDCCKSLYERTSADYWRTYDVGKFPAFQVAQVMTGAEDPSVHVMAPKPLNIQPPPVPSHQEITEPYPPLHSDSPDAIIHRHNAPFRIQRFGTWQRFITAARIPLSIVAWLLSWAASAIIDCLFGQRYKLKKRKG